MKTPGELIAMGVSLLCVAREARLLAHMGSDAAAIARADANVAEAERMFARSVDVALAERRMTVGDPPRGEGT